MMSLNVCGSFVEGKKLESNIFSLSFGRESRLKCPFQRKFALASCLRSTKTNVSDFAKLLSLMLDTRASTHTKKTHFSSGAAEISSAFLFHFFFLEHSAKL